MGNDMRMIDIVGMTVGDIPRKWGASRGDKIAMIVQGKGGNRETTWKRLDEMSSKHANALEYIGVKKGDHVAILLSNMEEFLYSVFGNAKLGAVTVPINPMLKGAELDYTFNKSDTDTIIFSAAHRDMVQALVSGGKLPNVKRLIYVGDDQPENTLHYRNLVNHASARDYDRNVKPSDLSYIFFTTGTTGIAKGVMHTHFGTLSCALSSGLMMHTTTETRVTIATSMFHSAVHGVFMMAPALFGGSFAICIDPTTESEAEFAASSKATVWFLPVPLWLRVLKIPDLMKKYDYSAVNTLFSGASVVPDELKAEFIKLFPNAELVDGYGFTESGPSGCTLHKKDTLRKPGSIGVPWPYVQMAILDDNNQPVGANQMGEICVRGPAVMKGYYKDPEATESAFAGGWLHSGDMGEMDEEGFFYIKDRKKDMIVRGGINVSSREVEDALYTVPGILEVAVFAVPDADMGEEIMACIIPKAGETVDSQKIIDHITPNYANYKIPRYIKIVNDYPRNVVGKILKRDLRIQYKEESSRGNKLRVKK